MKRSYYILPILMVALFPSIALANAGTPLMWASMLHLVFGNAIIGLIEGLIVAWIFKCPKWRSILILIAANYASAWAGGLFVVGYLTSLPDVTIQNITFWFITFTVVTFLVTLLIEFPFFWFSLRSREHSLRKVLMATSVINSISYTLLFSWYWMSSGTSMITQLEIMPLHEMKLSAPYVLYFLSHDGDQVLRMDLNDSNSKQLIAKVKAHHRNDRLFVRPRIDSGFDLFVRIDSEVRGEEKELLVIESFSEQAPVEWRIVEKPSEEAEGTWFNFGQVPSLVTESDWEFRTGFWSIEGISGENQKNGKKVNFSLETPFAAWPVRNATHLTGDYIVFQLGDDQICMIHPESRKIVLIARGKGPIVAKPKMSNKAISANAKGRAAE